MTVAEQGGDGEETAAGRRPTFSVRYSDVHQLGADVVPELLAAIAERGSRARPAGDLRHVERCLRDPPSRRRSRAFTDQLRAVSPRQPASVVYIGRSRTSLTLEFLAGMPRQPSTSAAPGSLADRRRGQSSRWASLRPRARPSRRNLHSQSGGPGAEAHFALVDIAERGMDSTSRKAAPVGSVGSPRHGHRGTRLPQRRLRGLMCEDGKVWGDAHGLDRCRRGASRGKTTRGRHANLDRVSSRMPRRRDGHSRNR